jgi:hypothetical protein
MGLLNDIYKKRKENKKIVLEVDGEEYDCKNWSLEQKQTTQSVHLIGNPNVNYVPGIDISRVKVDIIVNDILNFNIGGNMPKKMIHITNGGIKYNFEGCLFNRWSWRGNICSVEFICDFFSVTP